MCETFINIMLQLVGLSSRRGHGADKWSAVTASTATSIQGFRDACSLPLLVHLHLGCV